MTTVKVVWARPEDMFTVMEADGAPMKKLIPLSMLFLSINGANALTLEGSVHEDASAEHFKFYRGMSDGHIGIRVSSSGSVGYVHPGSPAEKAGIEKGDHISTVDGRKHAVTKISGVPGTTVVLEVERRDKQFTVEVLRIAVEEIRP